MQYTIFLFLAPLAAGVLLVTIGYTWLRRGSPVARTLIVYLLSAMGFLVTNTLELLDPTEAGTLRWAQAAYLFITTLPLAWIIFAMRYTNRPLNAWTRRLLCLEPVLMFGLALTNAQHGWLWSSITFVPVRQWLAMQVEHGPAFWIHATYGLVLLLAGAYFILRDFFTAHPLYRHQAMWTVAGALLPLGINALYLFDIIPGLTKDFSPIAFALAGAAFGRGIARYHLLNLMPVARATLIDTMPEGLIVLDHTRSVIDLNPAAREILGLAPGQAALGLPLAELWPASAGWPPEPLNWPPVVHPRDGAAGERAFALRTAILQNNRPSLNTPARGWLVVLSDITGRVQAESALERANAALLASNAALRQMNVDLEARIAARTVALTQRAQELEALARVSSTLRKAAGLEELLQILLMETTAVLEARAGYVFLLEEDELVLTATVGLEPLAVGTRLSPCRDPLWEVVETGRTLHLPAGAAPETLFHQLALPEGDVALAPIRASNRILGLLFLAFPHPLGGLFAEYERPLTAIAEMAGNALQRVRTVENLEAMVQARTRDLSALYEVTAAISQPLTLPEICQRVMGIVMDVLAPSAAAVSLINEQTECLENVSWVGLASVEAPALTSHRYGLPQQVLEQGGIVVAPALAEHGEETLAGVGAPVRSKGRVLGALVVYAETIGRFSAEDIALLAAIGDHLGGTVERFQLRRRAEEAAVMEERNRLARDLHDSVTQSLYSLVLFAEAGGDALAAANPEKAASHLARLRDTAQQALKEMRLLIYELRPLALKSEGLVGALRRRLETVEQRAGIDARLEVEQLAPLSERVEAGLYGIAQEALNNVIKHARATQVVVRLLAGEAGVTLEICDNGQGFPTLPVEGGIGLSSMRERARALGGEITFDSTRGRGVRVLAVIQPEEMA